MVTVTIDPLIHDPARLRIVATLAALPPGNALSATRLQDMTGLSPGNLITCLRELGHAGYVRTGKAGGGAPATLALTRGGRAALDRYTTALQQLARMAREDYQAPAPGLRAGDADRAAAAAALGEHFAHGRLTLNELNARLDATLTAATHGELSRATRDLPDLTGPPARDSFPRTIAVRDTKQHGRGPVLRFAPAAWRRFAEQVKGPRSLATDSSPPCRPAWVTAHGDGRAGQVPRFVRNQGSFLV
jgi:DNA-binding PadR family transcriptional regulator